MMIKLKWLCFYQQLIFGGQKRQCKRTVAVREINVFHSLIRKAVALLRVSFQVRNSISMPFYQTILFQRGRLFVA